MTKRNNSTLETFFLIALPLCYWI